MSNKKNKVKRTRNVGSAIVSQSDKDKMRQAMERGNFAEAAEIGLNIYEKAKENTPPLIFHVLGEAFFHLARSMEAEKNNNETIKQRQQAAYDESWHWLKKSYDAGLLNSPDAVAKIIEVGSLTTIPHYQITFDIIKVTLNKINSAVYAMPPKETMKFFYLQLFDCAKQTGQMVDAFEAARYCWQNADTLSAKLSNYDALLLFAHCLDFTDKDLFELAVIYDTFFKDVKPYQHDWAAIRKDLHSSGRKIRLGYVSPNCYIHVASQFFYGLLAYADKEKFEIFMYSRGKVQDEVTDKIRAVVDYFVDISKTSIEDAAKIIYEDNIDILVDVAGHTSYTGLPILAYKPAPIQISGIGYLSTTGLRTVDYYITDKIVDPPPQENGIDHQRRFTEKLLYLTSQFSYIGTLGRKVPDVRETPCIKNGYITFGVFNQYRKITDTMLKAWKIILDRLPNAKLLLKAFVYADEDLVARAKQRFDDLGLPPDRVIFEVGDAGYMARYLDVDIALDTYPYTGGGTTCDALYMGVPVITMYGERRNTRFSLGILTNVGLKHLAVDNIEQYIDTALVLANDIDLLNTLHKKIRPMFLSSVVGQSERYTKEFEEKLLEIVELED